MKRSKKVYLFAETVADIAYFAGASGYYSGDSRADMQKFIEIAFDFTDLNSKTNWDKKDYMEEIEKFTYEQLGLVSKFNLSDPAVFDKPWDNLEIERIREEHGDIEILGDREPAEPNDYYSVYAHQVEGGVQCIADVPTEDDAQKLVAMISKAVRSFKDNNYLALYDNKSLQERILKIIETNMSSLNSDWARYQKEALIKQINNLFI